MQNASDLKTQLQAIHRKSYPAYKSLKGSYRFRDYILHIDHVQGDPFASPSHIRIQISHKTACFPVSYYKDTLTRVTLADYLTRQFETQVGRYTFRAKGSGKSGLISVTVGRKYSPVPPVILQMTESPQDFLLVFRQTDVPSMPQNWKKSFLIFSRSVSRKLFSIRTPSAPNWNKQSSLQKIRLRSAHS